MAFIFGALLEFALVNYAARKDISSTQQRMIKLHQQYNSAVVHHQSIDATSGIHHLDSNAHSPHQQQFQSLLHPTPTAQQSTTQSNRHSFVHLQQHQPKRLGICFRLCCRLFVRRYKERSKRIDVVSRLVNFKLSNII
jgi:hypothetical protein